MVESKNTKTYSSSSGSLGPRLAYFGEALPFVGQELRLLGLGLLLAKLRLALERPAGRR